MALLQLGDDTLVNLFEMKVTFKHKNISYKLRKNKQRK